ncbi:Misato segment II tubulin-like domain-containing protein [Fomitopsis serialis]|uniref:Misato segment II tubulin-like domain-containing protein n=1 Tax=Fomitopsis serialis TaxID=139415 RepID=UPI0020081C79|nr:Misato segment II tubulin-like domain-containing protein [Neoantrodia serialis]KAH9915313.1 Misato segment II tubulin-like domain-containing protein [Neoantrodia serialis]
MKEIIYIQAGQLANFAGTHFWNTQEAYFTYGEDEQSEIDHDVSFREGSTVKGESTYSPRLLLFDRRSNFGRLSSTSGLYNSEEDDLQEEFLWNNGVVESRQDRIPQSNYHLQLDREADDDDSPKNDEDGVAPQVLDSDVRFWSDYSRVFLHPRSMQRLPDPPDWESTEGNWAWSKDAFERYNTGIQVMNDTSTFGGFTNSFLTTYRDEFPKLPCLAFPLLSHNLPGHVDNGDDIGMRAVINDALYLHSLASLSTMTVPVQAPGTWVAGEWLNGIDLYHKSVFQTSAILSTHIESVTLPLRLKGSMEDLDSICGALNWGGSNRFAHLSGVFPLPTPPQAERDFARRSYDFSLTSGGKKKAGDEQTTRLEFARIYVARGFSSSDRRTLDAWTESRRPFPYTIFAPGYPIPSSFPTFLESPPPSTGNKLRAPTAHVLSSLHTTSHTSELFAAYSTVVDDCVRRGAEVLSVMGLEKDDVIELRDGLWALRDTYVGLEEGDAVVQDIGLDDDEE